MRRLSGALLLAAVAAALAGCDDGTGTGNLAPAAADDTAVTLEDTSVTTGDVTANDSDPEGGTVAVVGFTLPADGDIVYNGDGTFTYTPDPDFAGDAVFTYTAGDPAGGTSWATVTITVTPVNDAPRPEADSASIVKGQTATIAVLANDFEADGDLMSIDSFDAATYHGGVVTQAGDTLIYTPAAGFAGADAFHYTMTDGAGGYASAPVTVWVGPVKLIGEAAGDAAGSTVAGVGDVNGDGIDDVLVGAGAYDGPAADSGAAYLVYGSTAGFAGTSNLSGADAVFEGLAFADILAYHYISGAGDVNGDGFQDILVSALETGSFVGTTYLVYGSAGGLSGVIPVSAADATFVGEAASDYAGYVGGGGDVNGDGFDDVLVGAKGNSAGGAGSGAAYLIYGLPSGPVGTMNLSTSDAKFTGEAAGDAAGCSVSGAADVNGDGFDDIVVGARTNAEGGVDAGAAYLIYGSPVGPSGTSSLADADARFIGEAADDWAGICVSDAGDVNGDGYDDLIIAAHKSDAGGVDSGAVYLIYGSQSGPSGTLSLADADAKFTGEAAGDLVGYKLAAAGDVNGDGYDDLVMGAHQSDAGGIDSGAAYIIFGSAAGPSGTTSLAGADVRFVGEAAGDQAGYFVSGAGDVNGDGFDDVVVGGPSNDEGGANSGAAHIIFGSPDLAGEINP